MKRSTSMRTSIASPTALDSCSLTSLIASSSTLATSAARPSIRSPASSDAWLRDRRCRFDSAPIASSKPGADATDGRFEVGDLDAVVLVDPLLHRQRAVDHLHVDGVDALRQDLTVLGQLASHVGAGLIDQSAHVAEALVDVAGDAWSPSSIRRDRQQRSR